MTRGTFIISRTDAIGDVVLTLPVAAVLRQIYPEARILFLGRSYTEDVIRACEHVDGFLNWDEWRDLSREAALRAMRAVYAGTIIHVFPNREIARLAWKAGIEQRIGTSRRIYHWLYCNRLVRLARKHSPYHEAQLNLRLLQPLGARPLYRQDEIAGLYGLTRLTALPAGISAMPDPDRFNLILHPASRGSAREWGLENFRTLVRLLPADRYRIFLTGTAAEASLLKDFAAEFPLVTNLCGQLTLGQLMTFISKADGLVAASTGPLHLAAALGIHALGIYPPIRPMHPGRWAPVGPMAKVFVRASYCDACRDTGDCACMRDVEPQELVRYLLTLQKVASK
ncbi:MAG TPA: glycosyltransferase family 9 protein [Puia sp.]|nr:glycosyltransferase family 9 protein [Puia sp.]